MNCNLIAKKLQERTKDRADDEHIVYVDDDGHILYEYWQDTLYAYVGNERYIVTP